MKSTNQTLLIFFISVLVFLSCTDQSKTVKLTTFSGKIKNNATNEVRLEGNDTVYKGEVNSNGFFKMQFTLKEESTFTYTGNEFTTIHLSPGDSIHLSVDSKDWRTFDKTLNFSGNGSSKNNYFFSKSLIEYNLNRYFEKNLIKKKETDFIKAIDSVYTILYKHFENFQNKTPEYSHGMLQYENQSIAYSKKTKILRYYIRNKGLQNEEIVKKVTPLIENINLNNSQHIDLVSYNSLVIEYFKYLQKQDEDSTDPTKALSTTLINIDRFLENIELKSSVAQFFLKEYISGHQLEPSFFNTLKDQVSNSSLSAFETIYRNEKPLAISDKAPNFVLIDKNGKPYSLNTFKGTYIYIDVWASYCGPCIKEFPYFEQLKLDFKDKNITFVSVSLDRKEGDWLSSVAKNNMTAYQLKAENDWSSEFVKDYNLNYFGIPYYIIIDPNGTVIKLPGPKPSEARKVLNEILL